MATDHSTSPSIVEEGTHSFPRSRWFLDVVRYQPTQRPCEDRWSFAYDESSARLVVGVYDGMPPEVLLLNHVPQILTGHGGFSCADHISKVLPQALIKQPPSQHRAVFETVDGQLTEAFTQDHGLFKSKSSNWISNARIAKSGCMAIVCDVDLSEMRATLSSAGDCRLVVIRPSVSSSPGEEGPVVHHETEGLNSKSKSEQERLAKEHPGEDMVVVSGRLFGRLMSTRGKHVMPHSCMWHGHSHCAFSVTRIWGRIL